jgi:Asp/Glu/hydantoin racemase
MFQKEMATAVGVPLFTSSLMMVPLVYRTLKADQKVGILTVNSEALTQRHLEGVGVNGVPIALAGLQGGYFSSVVLGDRMEMDVDKAREELVEAAKGFVSKNPEVGAIVLECTNMPPFSKSIQGAVGLPVFDIVDLGNMIYHACAKFKYEGTM